MTFKNSQDLDNREVYLTVLDFLKNAYHKGKKNTNAEDWEKFRERLQVPSISKDEARAIGYWTMEN
ncbi:MAG: hypothetical protein WCR04_11935, partial [Fibrobacteraceae bacterium]